MGTVHGVALAEDGGTQYLNDLFGVRCRLEHRASSDNHVRSGLSHQQRQISSQHLCGLFDGFGADAAIDTDVESWKGCPQAPDL